MPQICDNAPGGPSGGRSLHQDPPGGRKTWLPALAWLDCLLCLALAWSDLGLSCLPCLGLVQQQQQRRRSCRWLPKAAGCSCWTRPRQGRQDRPRPDQAKARHDKQAKSRLPAESLQGLGPKGVLAGLRTPKTQNHTFLAPTGSPSNRFAQSRKENSQNVGVDLAR